MGISRVALCVSIFSAASVWSAAADSSGSNCTFQLEPDKFLSAQSRARRAVFDATQAVAKALRASTAKTDSTPIPHRNFIDDEIFNKLASMQVAPAQLTTDEEFFRRINLDLTGTIATPADMRAFLADTTPNKRDVVIDKLLNSTPSMISGRMWLGDLMQNYGHPGHRPPCSARSADAMLSMAISSGLSRVGNRCRTLRMKA